MINDLFKTKILQNANYKRLKRVSVTIKIIQKLIPRTGDYVRRTNFARLRKSL